MEQNAHQAAMRNAEASVRMEGFQITPEMREQCASILRGEMTVEECLKRFYLQDRKADAGQ